MSLSGRALRLTIFVGEGDIWHHKPLYHEIVKRARDAGLAGATVLRGPMGFGATSTIHNAGILDLSSNLPLVIELVDTEEKLRTFFGDLEALDDIGLVTLEKVEVIHYG